MRRPFVYPMGFMGSSGITSMSLVDSSLESSGDEFISAPSTIQQGDLLVIYDNGENFFSPPSISVPNGFTVAQTDTFAAIRSILSYKVADGSEAGTELVGMSAIGRSSILTVFRADKLLTSASHFSGGAELTSGNPSPQLVEASNGTAPLIVVAAYGTAVSNLSQRIFNPVKDGEIQNTLLDSIDQWVAYRIYLKNPQDTTVDMGDLSDEDKLLSAYIEVS